MSLRDLAPVARMGARHLATIVPEALYLGVGIDVTRPTEIRALVTNRCNYKCLQCGCWREGPSAEMTAEQWMQGLESLREFLGRFRVQFVGGEPFVKRGFVEILEFCGRRGVDFGVITNGSAFANRGLAGRFAASRPLKVEISVDGHTPDLHDRLRGAPGSLRAIEAGLRNLREARRAEGSGFPIRIKATLNSANFRSAPDLVRWAEAQGAASIDFEPIRGWTEEARGVLRPSAEECDALEGVVAELLRMQALGARVETSRHKLSGLPDFFRGRPVPPEVGTCRAGMRVFGVDPRGMVTSCDYFEPLGDLSRQSAREIWSGEVARRVRRETVACTRGCPYGCLASKPILHTIRRGLGVFGRSVVEPKAPLAAEAATG